MTYDVLQELKAVKTQTRDDASLGCEKKRDDDDDDDDDETTSLTACDQTSMHVIPVRPPAAVALPTLYDVDEV